MSTPLRLGQLLVRGGFVDPADVERALTEQRAGSMLPLGQILVRLGAIDEAELAHALAEQFGLPLVDLGTTRPEADALECLEAEQALHLQALPVVKEQRLLVVIAEPPTPALRRVLVEMTGCSVRFALAPAGELARALTWWYAPGVKPELPEYEPPAPPSAGDDVEAPVHEDLPVAAPREEVVADRVIGWLASTASDRAATTVHLDPDNEGWLGVRYGVDTQREGVRLPPKAGATLLHRILRAVERTADRPHPRGGSFLIRGETEALVRVHVTSTPTSNGTTVVVNLEPEAEMPPT